MKYKTYVKSEYNEETKEYTFTAEDGTAITMKQSEMSYRGVGSVKVPIRDIEVGDYSEVKVEVEGGYITEIAPKIT
jgi:hypothetical protein